MKKYFYIVDVFAEKPYSGNPLAVVVCEKFLAESTMQEIAAEMNFSETTFVLSKPQENQGYNIRIYTPSREIEFAGHPLLGTAQVIRKYLNHGAGDTVKLNLMQTQVSVNFEPNEVNLSRNVCDYRTSTESQCIAKKSIQYSKVFITIAAGISTANLSIY